MGFLDDAIREHLELKRRRGADPADVERAEREALGPVRRHPEPLEGENYGEEGLGSLDQAQPEHEGRPAFEGEHGALDEHPPAAYEQVGNHLPDDHFAEHAMPAQEQAPAEHLADERPPPDTGPIERYYQPPVEHDLHEPVLAPEPALDDPYEPEPELGHDAAPDVAHAPQPGETAAPPPHPAPTGPPTEEHPPPHLSEPTQEYEVSFDEEPEEREGSPHEEDVLEETPEFLQDTPDHDRLWFEQRPPRDFDFEG